MARDVKARVAEVTREELLPESMWLRRLVLRELQRNPSGEGAVREPCSKRRELCSGLYVRLRKEDRLLLHERAAARGMASATYVSALVRSHLRTLVPVPKVELAALKQAVAELGAVGRNLNQIARAANSGGAIGGVGREEIKAILRVCEALRDHTKGLIKANRASWEAGHAEY